MQNLHIKVKNGHTPKIPISKHDDMVVSEILFQCQMVERTFQEKIILDKVAISSGKNKQTRGEKPCHKTMDMKP
jgi:hypothetical protein